MVSLAQTVSAWKWYGVGGTGVGETVEIGRESGAALFAEDAMPIKTPMVTANQEKIFNDSKISEDSFF